MGLISYLLYMTHDLSPSFILLPFHPTISAPETASFLLLFTSSHRKPRIQDAISKTKTTIALISISSSRPLFHAIPSLAAPLPMGISPIEDPTGEQNHSTFHLFRINMPLGPQISTCKPFHQTFRHCPFSGDLLGNIWGF